MNKLTRTLAVALLALCLLAMAACNTTPGGTNPADTSASTSQGGTPNGTTSADPSNPSNPSDPSNPGSSEGGDEAAPVVLTFNGLSLDSSVSASEAGITVEGNAFVLSKGGTYELKGDLSNGQIKVSIPKTEEITLILNNFTASCTTSAVLYVESAGKATLELAAGSVNSMTDASVYQFASPTEDKPNACIYAEDDLTIKGKGTLTVKGNYNNGIGCKNDLRIKDCTLTVSAPNNIVRGNDSVEIESANVTLSGGEDAIKTSATDRTDKGYLLISGGATVHITCSDDALQATVSVTVEAGCTVSGQAGDAAINCDGTVNADAEAMSGLQSAQ